jgi:hypothetical protein
VSGGGRIVRGAAAVLAVLAPSVAAADPGALRAAVAGATLVGEVGAPTTSAAWWPNDGLGIAVHVRAPGASVGASVGTRALHADGWGVDAFLAGGLTVPVRDPGVAVTVSPAARAGWRGPKAEAGLGLAVPLAVGLAGGGVDGVGARVPVLLEPAVGFDVGPVRLGATLSAGPVFALGSPIGFETGARLVVAGG